MFEQRLWAWQFAKYETTGAASRFAHVNQVKLDGKGGELSMDEVTRVSRGPVPHWSPPMIIDCTDADALRPSRAVRPNSMIRIRRSRARSCQGAGRSERRKSGRAIAEEKVEAPSWPVALGKTGRRQQKLSASVTMTENAIPSVVLLHSDKHGVTIYMSRNVHE